jgi:predicted transposase YbfD/YdcC
VILYSFFEYLTLHIDSFREHFSSVGDPRQSAKVFYPLFDVLFGTLCAMIAGAKGWNEIREYVLGHHAWFIKNNLFQSGVPVDDTFARIISTVKPEAFRACFLTWMSAVHNITQGDVIAIDGKTLRGSYNRDDRSSTIHMISAYASANKLVLGQLKTDCKSNEITAIPELIKLLDLRGALVTIDAMACQTKIAKAIVEQGGDYLLAVKGNQSTLAKAVHDAFNARRMSMPDTAQLKTELKHGRVESRTSHVLSADILEGDFSRWSDLKTIAMIESYRTEKGKAVQLEYRYYISSKALTAEQVSTAVRAHWAIESMHWVLDVSMQEDACQIYKNNAAENLACLRHMSLNMLQAESTKISIPNKQKRCWMKTTELEKILVAGIAKQVN